MAGMDAYRALAALFAECGNADYVGEAVSQLEHATQCAKCAADAGADEEVVLGALLHDVGHMLALRSPGDPSLRMGPYGAVNHEGAGAAFLFKLGLSERVCSVVRRHVDAKRYLCWKNPAYHAKLSTASQATLVYQGGPMGDGEAVAFAADPLFSTIIKMRTWDEAAKVQGMVVPGLESYADRIARVVDAELATRS